MAEAQLILNKILPRIAKEQNFVNYEIKIKPVTSNGGSFTTTLYNVTISDSDNIVHMFAKVAALGDELRVMMPKVYEIEILAYTKVLQVYERIQDEHKVPEENRLTLPKFYGYVPTKYEEIVILEDLAVDGYQVYDRVKSINWDFASASVRELAKLHALAFAYNEYNSEEYNDVLEFANSGYWAKNDSGILINFFDSVIKKAIDNVQSEHKDKLQRFFETFDKATFGDFYRTSGRNVLGHGDFRTSNIMHKIQNDGTTATKIIDLQTLYGGSPVNDLLYFIMTGSDEEFRAQYYEKLLYHYYNELAAAMKRLHLVPEKVYSRADFEHDLKLKFSFGLIVAVIFLPSFLADTQDTHQVNEDTGMSAFDVEKSSDLYIERINGIVNDYVKWGVLK